MVYVCIRYKKIKTSKETKDAKVFILSLFMFYSKKSLNFLALDGCLNLRKAFASICLIRSLVTLNLLPTSSRV